MINQPIFYNNFGAILHRPVTRGIHWHTQKSITIGDVLWHWVYHIVVSNNVVLSYTIPKVSFYGFSKQSPNGKLIIGLFTLFQYIPVIHSSFFIVN